MGLPPFDAGAGQLTMADAVAAIAVGVPGAPGMVAGVTLFEGADAGPVPNAFVAVTVKV